MTVVLPTPHEVLVDADGKINEIWYRYLSDAATATNDTEAALTALTTGPSVAKAWGLITSAETTTPVLSADYNTASVTGTTAFAITVTLDTPFTSTNYSVLATPQVSVFSTSTVDSPLAVLTGQTSISFVMQSTGYTAISFACYGDQ